MGLQQEIKAKPSRVLKHLTLSMKTGLVTKFVNISIHIAASSMSLDTATGSCIVTPQSLSDIDASVRSIFRI